MGAKMSVLGLIMSFSPYLRFAMARFPFRKLLCPIGSSAKVCLEIISVDLVYVPISKFGVPKTNFSIYQNKKHPTVHCTAMHYAKRT